MTNTTAVGVFTPQDAREIRNRVLGSDSRNTKLFEYSEANSQGWHYGIMKEDLDAACDPLKEYTQAKAAVLMYEEGVDNLDLKEVEPVVYQVDLTNRSPFASYFQGELVLFRWVVKEWAIIGQAVQHIQAVLQQDLKAAVDTLDDPSTAKAKILFKTPAGDLKVMKHELTIINRNKHISVRAGVYCKAEYIQGEWQLYNADCPGTSSFSSSESGSSSC